MHHLSASWNKANRFTPIPFRGTTPSSHASPHGADRDAGDRAPDHPGWHAVCGLRGDGECRVERGWAGYLDGERRHDTDLRTRQPQPGTRTRITGSSQAFTDLTLDALACNPSPCVSRLLPCATATICRARQELLPFPGLDVHSLLLPSSTTTHTHTHRASRSRRRRLCARRSDGAARSPPSPSVST